MPHFCTPHAPLLILLVCCYGAHTCARRSPATTSLPSLRLQVCFTIELILARASSVLSYGYGSGAPPGAVTHAVIMTFELILSLLLPLLLVFNILMNRIIVYTELYQL